MGYGISDYIHALACTNGHFSMRHTEEDDEVGFLNPNRVKETAKKQESGELTCNIDDPEDCESCSG